MLVKNITSGQSHSRSLIVLAARPHNHISRRCTGILGPVVSVVAAVRRLGEIHDRGRDTGNVARSIGRESTEQTLAGFLGQVRLLQNTLSGVDVRQVKDGGRVAGVEDGRKSDTLLQRLDNTEVKLVIDDGASFFVVDRVNALVVAIVFITVLVLDLTTVSYDNVSILSPQLDGKIILGKSLFPKTETYQSSAGREHR